MPTTRFYSSSDAGAPALTYSPGALIAVLRACLVDGYGSKTAAGWTMPYVDPDKYLMAVFQPSEGNLHVLQVDDTSNNYSTLTGYAEMTGLFDGTAAFGPVYIGKRNTTTGASNWYVIADETAVMIFIATASAYPTSYGMSFFGKLIGGISTDSENTFLFGPSTSSNSQTSPIGNTYLQGNVTMSQATVGKMASALTGGISATAMLTYAGQYGQYSGNGYGWGPILYNGSLSLSAPYLLDSTNQYSACRGRIPFLWIIRNATPFAQFPSGFMVDTNRMVIRQGALSDTSTSGGAVIVETA